MNDMNDPSGLVNQRNHGNLLVVWAYLWMVVLIIHGVCRKLLNYFHDLGSTDSPKSFQIVILSY